MRNVPTAALALAAAVCMAAGPAFASGVVKGKAVHRELPAAGVTVSAFADSSRGFAGTPDHRSVPSAPDGSFSLDLPRRALLPRRGQARGSGFPASLRLLRRQSRDRR